MCPRRSESFQKSSASAKRHLGPTNLHQIQGPPKLSHQRVELNSQKWVHVGKNDTKWGLTRTNSAIQVRCVRWRWRPVIFQVQDYWEFSGLVTNIPNSKPHRANNFKWWKFGQIHSWWFCWNPLWHSHLSVAKSDEHPKECQRAKPVNLDDRDSSIHENPNQVLDLDAEKRGHSREDFQYSCRNPKQLPSPHRHYKDYQSISWRGARGKLPQNY